MVRRGHAGLFGEVNIQPDTVVADLGGRDLGIGKKSLVPEFLQHIGHLITREG